MKYLKLFEAYDNDKDNDKIESIKTMINYEFIADLKELCMDLLDDGYTLTIDFRIVQVSMNDSPVFTTSLGTKFTYSAGEVEIDHKNEEYHWHNLSYFHIKQKPNSSVHYTFYLSHKNGAQQTTCRFSESDDISLSIKSMYPELSIKAY